MRKYISCVYAVIISVFVLFNFNCEKVLLPVDSDDHIEYLQGNTNARVILKVLDNYTMSPIAGVKISIVGVDSSVCNSNGIVIFDSIKVGSYLVSCDKDGYENTLQNFNLVIDSNSNTVPVVSQSTDVLFMARKGVTVRGNLYYEKDEQKYLANGATVECRLIDTSIFFEEPVLTTSSKNGNYSFNNLPEHSDYIITVLPFATNDKTYKQDSLVLVKGKSVKDTLRAEDIILEESTDGNFIVPKHNLNKFTVNDSLVIEFSEPVDTDLIEPDSINVSIFTGITGDEIYLQSRILTKQIWRNDNRKLVIIPFDGVWIYNQDYILEIREIRSVSGKPLKNTDFLPYIFSANMSGKLDDVKNINYRVGSNDSIKADFNTNRITLYWSELSNATSYHLYTKTSEDSVWTFQEEVLDTIQTIDTTGMFNEGKHMKFIVLGKNSTSISSFETAEVLTVRDETSPRIEPLIIFKSGFNRSDYYYADTFDIEFSPYLPEPMDTTVKPTITVTEGSYTEELIVYGDPQYTIDPQKCTWIWTSNQSGILRVTRDALKNSAYDILKVDFTSVSDMAGNKADTTQRAGYITIETR